MTRRDTFATLIAAIVLALLAGCLSRVSPYDDTIAAGLTSLRSSNTRFFDELQQTAGTPGAKLESHAAWYEETRAEIVALRTRAAAYGMKNDPTVRSLELLGASLDELEKVHAKGISAGEIPVLRTLFDSQLRMLIELESAKRRPADGEVTP